MESDPTGMLTVRQREGRFSVNKHLESLSAVLKGEVINKRKTTPREVENQAQHELGHLEKHHYLLPLSPMSH